MYKIQWDKETGGVKLSSRIEEGTLGTSPRPVFWEELDLLKLNELGWLYPHSDEPLLWAVNKQYWHRGKLLFEAKGANIYDDATVIFQSGCEKMNLEPIDVKKMLKVNSDYMFLLESEAIEFINETWQQYAGARKSVDKVQANQLDYEAMVKRLEAQRKQKMAIVKQDCDSFDIMPFDLAQQQGKKVYETTKINSFLASFSGGKDSQVVLDLCTRAIPSTEFEVIYSDTGYELPPSLGLYEQIQKEYKEKFPDLKFSIARNHESVLNYWDKIGTPSDKHRWCCAVMKTAPLYRMLKVAGTNKQAKVLTFDGVRAEESTRRSNYDRIGKGVKHDTVINARPILFWNSSEIFLYIFKHKLPLNPAYRQGMTRVGCLVCPFANEWNEMITKHHYSDSAEPFVSKLESFAKKSGIKDVKKYIADGGWKRRSSGNMVDHNSFIYFKTTGSSFSAIIDNPKIPIASYFQTIGSFTKVDDKVGFHGEISVNKSIYKYTVTIKGNKYAFEIDNISDVILVGLLKRVLYKSTYCIQCETCEVECPTGALSVYPIVKIDSQKCISCHKCLEFHDKGCIVANSLTLTNGNMTNKVSNIDRYKNFGLKEEWVEEYLMYQNDYWTSNHGLNENYQIPSLKAWLKDAEIIDDKNNITELGKLFSDSDFKMDYSNLIWEIIWINLSYNSFIVNWFVNNTTIGNPLSQKIMEEMVSDKYPVYKEKTVHNAVYQLRRTLKESPIGAILAQYNETNKESFVRHSYSELSAEAIAYSLYRYASMRGILSLRVSDFYNDNTMGGVAKEFGITKSVFDKNLRSLNSLSNRVLIAELNMGLDSITLRDDLTPITCLQQLTR